MRAIVIILCVGVLAAAMPQAEKQFYNLESAEEHFEGFIQQHNKQYDTEKEKQVRFDIFKQNLKNINQLNANSDYATFGVTQFADLTLQEFQMYNNLKLKNGVTYCTEINGDEPVPGNPPTEFNWQSKNAVTEVKDNQGCASSWAFSSIGNVEGQYAIKHGKLVSLSVQELLDCDKINGACDGGYIDIALRQLIRFGGVMSDQSYPYKAQMENCTFKKDKVVVVLKDCSHYNFTNEENLRKILYNIGPLAIGINADPLRYYNGGILNVKDCPVDDDDYGVLLVGYGEDNGVPYWLLKSSWGTKFGLNGYLKLQRNENTCNLLGYGAFSAILA